VQQVLGGRYRIERPVGRGGLTDVYEATDLTLERRVAVKVLHEELDEEPAVRHLFEDAARGAASLTHPNIVSVLDFGDDDGISYIVTEWMDEPTLAVALTAGPLAAQRVAEVGVDVSAALAEAHAHGLLHRGLKPADVFLEPAGEARVSDFGVTRAAERARNLDREARVAEATYVSPERAHGRPADARTDLYGLGLLLYEAATGRPAATGSSPAEIAGQHLEAYPPRPREVNPAVPAELEAVLARLLAKNPEARLPSAEVVHDELQGLLDSGVLAGAGVAAAAGAAPPPTAPPPEEEYDEDYYEPEEAVATAAAAAAAAGQGQVVRIGGNDSATTILPAAPPYRYDTRRRPPWILWAGLGVLALVIILIAVALTRGGGGGTPTVVVPNVVERSQDDAVALLTGLGFKANPVSLPNETVAAGIVYQQDPPAGRKLRKGSTVSLSVSSGPVETTTTTSTTVAPTTVVTARRTPTTRRVTSTVRTVPRTAPTTRATAPTTPPTTTAPPTTPTSTTPTT
jgi:eukaryotic-like serine/threonine-protein kinase